MPGWPNLEKLAEFFKVAPETLIGTPDLDDSTSQLDNIEAKLDRVLTELGATPPADDERQQTAQDLEAAAEPLPSEQPTEEEPGETATGEAEPQ